MEGSPFSQADVNSSKSIGGETICLRGLSFYEATESRYNPVCDGEYACAEGAGS